MNKTLYIKINFILGLLLIFIGLIYQQNISISNFSTSNKLNLKLKEVDTYYENNSSIEYMSYVDTSWAFPTTTNYYISNNYNNYHPAIDIVTNGDFNVYSAYAGVVVTNSYKYDNGNYLVIKQDNGYYVLYAHLSQKLVDQNSKVEKGQLIGIMGKTGFATGIHLHFSVWNGYPYNSSHVNPLSFY